MNFITTIQLQELLDDLAGDCRLIAPVKEGQRRIYRPVAGVEQIDWGSARPMLPVKEYFFPATERLLEILPVETAEEGGRDYQIVETLPAADQVIFDVRPCDARGLRSLDALFLDQEPPDAYYSRHRERATLIGVACDSPTDSCFCTAMGGAPDERRDVDLMLHRQPDGFIVDVVTEKGAGLLSTVKLPPWEGDLPEYDLPVKWAPPEVRLFLEHFDDPYWQSMAERCMSCRICAYACPTCRCFDVRDERLLSPNGGNAYERIRLWDSCARPGYRTIAGGHNPRAEKGERLRNRFLCKLYYFEDQYGAAGCTGCGRCVELCPVNIDIREVMQVFTGEYEALK
jgi:ferredoxin